MDRPSKIVIARHVPVHREDRVYQVLSSLGVEFEYCNPVEGDTLPDPTSEYLAAVVYGGEHSVNDSFRCDVRHETEWANRWVSVGKPYLGICYGGQLLASAAGADVSPHREGLCEIGYTSISPTASAEGFLDKITHFYQWHREGFAIPESAVRLASGDRFPNQAFRIGQSAYGLQFHPEATPGIINSWLFEWGQMLSLPGAQNREQQLADIIHYDSATKEWVTAFIGLWRESW